KCRILALIDQEAIARRTLSPYQDAHWAALLKPLGGRAHAPDSVNNIENRDFRGAAILGAAQGRSVQSRISDQRPEPWLDRSRRDRNAAPDFSRSAPMARDQPRMRGAADNKPGDPFQHDWDILQPDPPVLNRRRCGTSLARGAQWCRVASGD